MSNPFRDYIQLVRAIQRAKREGRTDELLRAANENARIQAIMMRTMKHESVQGAGEIGWGMAMLCFALASYTAVVLPDSRWGSGLGWLLLLGACLAMPVSRWAVRKFVTQPRTGYVAFSRGRRFWISMVVSLIAAVVVSVGMVRLLWPEMTQIAQSQMRHAGATSPGTPAPGTLSVTANLVLAGMGPANAVLYLMFNAVSLREHRWKWLLAVFLALGPLAICALVPGNYVEVSRPVMLFLGLVCLGSGGATLILFWRHTPLPALETE
jgi:hypothetical protein